MGEKLCNNNTLVDFEPISHFNKSFGIVLVVLTLLFTFVLLALFLRARRWSTFISRRMEGLTYIMVAGGLLQLFWVIRVLVGRDVFPCPVYLNLTTLIIMLQAGPNTLHIAIFYYRLMLNRKLATFSYEAIVRKQAAGNIEQAVALKRTLNSRGPDSLVQLVEMDQEQLADTEATEEVPRFNSSMRAGSSRSSVFDELNADEERELKKLMYFASEQFAWTGVLVMMVLGLLSAAVRTNEFFGCVGCALKRELFYEVILFCGIVILFGLYYSYKVRNEQDPLRMKQEFIFTGACYFIGIISFLFDAIDPNDVDYNGDWTWLYFWVFASMLLVAAHLGVPLYYSYLPKLRRMSKIESIAANELSLEEILNWDVARELFKAHLVSEFSIENYLFWQEATMWKKMPESLEKQHQKIEILKWFIEPNSVFEINISDSARQKILAAETNNLFDNAVAQTYSLMQSDSLPRFRMSKAYNRLMKDNEVRREGR